MLKKNIIFRLENSYVFSNPEVLYKYKLQNFNSIVSKLEVLNPMNTLKRGYSIARVNGKVVGNVSLVKVDDELELELYSVKIDAKVIKVGEKNGK